MMFFEICIHLSNTKKYALITSVFLEFIHGNQLINVNGEWLFQHGNRFNRATVNAKYNAVSGIYTDNTGQICKHF